MNHYTHKACTHQTGKLMHGPAPRRHRLGGGRTCVGSLHSTVSMSPPSLPCSANEPGADLDTSLSANIVLTTHAGALQSSSHRCCGSPVAVKGLKPYVGTGHNGSLASACPLESYE